MPMGRQCGINGPVRPGRSGVGLTCPDLEHEFICMDGVPLPSWRACFQKSY